MADMTTSLNFYGVNKDVDPYALAGDKWSDVLNVQFKQGRSSLSEAFIENGLDLGAQPKYVIPSSSGGVPVAFYGTDDAIYQVVGPTVTNVSARAYGTGKWDGAFHNQVVLMTNGIEPPQAKLAGEQKFKDLPNFPEKVTAKVLRSFKGFIVAAGLEKNQIASPGEVMWSDVADPGSLPTTWAAAPDNLAGAVSLVEEPSEIVGMELLRDRLIIYKRDSVYSMNYVGGNQVFSFKQVLRATGALNKNCIIEFENKHFVVGINKFYVTDGASFKEVGNDVVYEHFSDILPTATLDDVFVAKNPNAPELYVCFKSSDTSVGCDRALVWNYQENTWSEVYIPDLIYAKDMLIPLQTPPTWSSVTGTWEEAVKSWNIGSLGFSRVLRGLRVGDTKAYNLSRVPELPTYYPDSFLERTGFSLGDDRAVKHVKSVIPNIATKGQVKFYVGASMEQDVGYKWKGPFTYDTSKKNRITCRVSGRHLGIRIISRDMPEVGRMTVTYETVGER